LLKLAGVNPPVHLQGHDFVNDTPRQYIYASRDRIDEVVDRQRAVRDERYKYIRSWHPQQPGGHRLLFRDNIDMMEELHVMYEAGELNAQQRLWFEPPGAERLFDVKNDPYELQDLSEDPDYDAVLDRMRLAMDDWLEKVEDWGNQSEALMIQGFLVDGEKGITKAPVVEQVAENVTITAKSGASIGYSVGDGSWRVYSGPLQVLAGELIRAKAVRYGWEESSEVMFEVQ
jgi:hypothetical protein